MTIETVMYKVIANDGEAATCRASVNGRVVGTIQFDRDEESKPEFLKMFTVGQLIIGGRANSPGV